MVLKQKLRKPKCCSSKNVLFKLLLILYYNNYVYNIFFFGDTTPSSIKIDGFYVFNSFVVNCGISHALSGVFTSPQYPSNYENNIHCGYLIDVPKNYTITLSVKEIITDSCCDHLMVSLFVTSWCFYNNQLHI